MFVTLQEIQRQVEPEKELNYLIDDYYDRVIGCLKSCVVHGGYTGVSHKKEYKHIEYGLLFALCADDDALF